MVTPPVISNTPPSQTKAAPIMDISQAVKPSKGWRRIKEIFIAEDLSTVKHKVFETVVVPSIKDFLYTIGTSTLGLIFYGESAVKAKNSFQSTFLSGGKYVSYSSYHSAPEKKLAPGMVTGYVEPLFDSYEDAKDCLNDMLEILDQYPELTVSDLYSHATVAKNGYRNEAVYNKWGWKNLGNAHVTMATNGNGYVLNLPRPKQLS